MLVTAFGVPTEFSMFGARILRALMDAANLGNHYVQADALEDLRLSLDGKKVGSILLFSEFPEKNITTITSKISKKSVIFYESPEISIEYTKNIRKMSFMDCMRFSGKNMALLSVALANPNSLVLKYVYNESLAAFLLNLCSYLEISQTQALIERVAAELGIGSVADFSLPLFSLMPMMIPSELCHDRSQGTLTPAELATVQALIPRYEDIEEKGLRCELVWDGSLFFVQNKQRELSAANGHWIDMLGPARYLYFGPYLFLPPGDWSMKVEFRVRGNNSGNRAEFDVVQDGAVLALSTFDIPASGIFEITADLVNEQPEKPIEFRVHMREGAIDGQFVLDRVRWRHGAGAFRR